MERIGTEVERELTRRGSGEGASLAALTSAWTAVVGPAVARNAWPARVGRDGTLYVNTSSATWALELTQLKSEIELRLRAAVGDHAPTGLRFTVGPVPEPPAAEEPDATPGEPVEVAPDVAAAADAVASAIEDPDLRELAARAARASLSRPPSGRRF
jgi:hypothetical protein